MLNKYPGIFEKKVSTTTRPAKKAEKIGKNYNLVSKEEFQKKIDKKDFVEYREIAGNMYGTCKKEL